ncbi:MAG: hypothetical protein WC189_04060 [Bacilli bacterium]
MTNGDKIRSMTDEQLADWLNKITNQEKEDWEQIGCSFCINNVISNKSGVFTKFSLHGCEVCKFENGLIGWLKSDSDSK